jgi:NTP pyrophosphatase (non-canonical NTP hydrolase)
MTSSVRLAGAPPNPKEVQMSGLQDLAAEFTKKIRTNFPDTDLALQQVLCLAEEAGEFVGAYRRWAGMARRQGPWADVRAELADVAITAYVTANILEVEDALEDFRTSLGEPVVHDEARQVRLVFLAAADLVDAFDRPISSRSLYAMRLAAVVNLAYKTARVLDFNLDAAIGEKAERIFSRGWRDKPAEVPK